MSDAYTIFEFKYTTSDPDGYYHTRWDKAIPAKIVGESLDGAIGSLKAMLGDPPRYRKWAIQVVRISQEPLSNKPEEPST